LANVTIVFGLYEQAANDSLVGGTYFAQAVSKSGTTISDWTSLKQENGVLPVVNNEKPINGGDSDSFNNFKSKIQSFFPNLSGVTAQVHYENDSLKGMKIKITTNSLAKTRFVALRNTLAPRLLGICRPMYPLKLRFLQLMACKPF
jgi:Protein involved in sex pheromone biosynthesis